MSPAAARRRVEAEQSFFALTFIDNIEAGCGAAGFFEPIRPEALGMFADQQHDEPDQIESVAEYLAADTPDRPDEPGSPLFLVAISHSARSGPAGGPIL